MSGLPERWVGEQATTLRGLFPARGPLLRPPLPPTSPQPVGRLLEARRG